MWRDARSPPRPELDGGRDAVGRTVVGVVEPDQSHRIPGGQPESFGGRAPRDGDRKQAVGVDDQSHVARRQVAIGVGLHKGAAVGQALAEAQAQSPTPSFELVGVDACASASARA